MNYSNLYKATSVKISEENPTKIDNKNAKEIHELSFHVKLYLSINMMFHLD